MCLLDHEFPAPKKNGISLLVASGFVSKWSTFNSKGSSRVSPVKWDLWYIHTQSQTNPGQRMFLLTVRAFCCRGFNYWIVVETVAGWTKDCSTPKVWGNHMFIFFVHIREAFTKNQILLEVSERFHISLSKMKPILTIVKLHPQQENLKKLPILEGSGATSFTGFPEGGDSLSRWSKLGRSNGFGHLVLKVYGICASAILGLVL